MIPVIDDLFGLLRFIIVLPLLMIRWWFWFFLSILFTILILCDAVGRDWAYAVAVCFILTILMAIIIPKQWLKETKLDDFV